jgi:uncharacterized damage-inducible protein DinB
VALGPPESFEVRPAASEWSARENLAHLARHAEVFLERLERIRREDRPDVGRYSAEQDAGWPAAAGRPLADVLTRLRETRARLLDWVTRLTPDELGRTGRHPTFGELAVPAWLDFFLLHEGHHLYVAMLRLGEARRAGPPRKETP